MAAVPKPSVKSAFKRASFVAVHPALLPMSVASKEKQLGFYATRVAADEILSRRLIGDNHFFTF